MKAKTKTDLVKNLSKTDLAKVAAGGLIDGLQVVHDKVCGYVADAMGDYYWDALDAYNAFRK